MRIPWCRKGKEALSLPSPHKLSFINKFLNTASLVNENLVRNYSEFTYSYCLNLEPEMGNPWEFYLSLRGFIYT